MTSRKADRLPQNLIEATRYFADPDVCVKFVAGLRWTDGPVCPRCEGTEHSYLTTRRVWKCKACKKQFSVKVGTIFEDSPIPLDKWLIAIWLIANAKNGISSHELGRSVGLTQKSAWFVLHRIRLAMQIGNFDRFTGGEVEVDETFVGGKAGNMHKAAHTKAFGGGDARKSTKTNKTVVAGAIHRAEGAETSRVTAAVVPDRHNATMQRYVRSAVAPGATLYTDMLPAYSALADEYDHSTIDHVAEYVNGRVHTNGIENFWALLKRGLKGTYVCASPEHLFRFVDERVFTFNERDDNDLGRFATVVAAVSGRRLTWADLTA
jgi:transposase-like protein